MPEDRLLARDCQRYQEMARQAKAARVAGGNPVRHRDMWRLVWSFQLPTNAVWVSAAGSQDTAYVAGYEGNMFVLVRLPFSPSIAGKRWSAGPYRRP